MSSVCQVCGNVGFSDGGDGFIYCDSCNSQAEGYIETGIDPEDLYGFGLGVYSNRHARHLQATPSQLGRIGEDAEGFGDLDAGDGVGPTGPSDFGSAPKRNLSYEDYYSEIRSRYAKGFQIMIQLQVKALVEKFNVSPLAVGLAGPIWLRFLAVTRILADEWADEAIQESESQREGEADSFYPLPRHRTEPHSMFGQRAVSIWFRSLCSTIPLPCSLAISFLVCHLAREPILTTDIVKWALEGKLPYFAAFLEIEKQIGPPSSACPISSSRMFRPTKIISLQKLEALAASIAQKIGLELPPVNFYGIASRFLVQLSIPVNNILRQACRIYEWSMPPELFISANKARLPTRICVMAILIVTIRILYDINGSGKWELSLSASKSSSSLANGNVKKPINSTLPTDDAEEDLSALYENASDDEDLELDAVSLLKMLETKFCEIRYMHGKKNVYFKRAFAITLLLSFILNRRLQTLFPCLADFSEDLSSYLNYCKDLIFSGSGPSFEDHEEEQIIRDLWDFYQNKCVQQLEYEGMHSRVLPEKISVADTNKTPREIKEHKRHDECNSTHSSDASSIEPQRDEAIRQLKLDMEENRFSYIPPRRQIKKMGYFFYARKRIEGSYVYACHADYYILLRACARVAQVDLRILHLGVMKFERRLKQLEERINRCFHVKQPNNKCDSPANGVEQNLTDDSGF